LKDISQDIHIEEDVIDDEDSGTTHLRFVHNSGSLVGGLDFSYFLALKSGFHR
jgi:hypothetical protein